MTAAPSTSIALVTGANTGIGRVTAVTLANTFDHVVLACRSEDKAQPVLDEIKNNGKSASFLALDLGDLASVKRAADTFLARGEPLQLLVNNAGLAGQQGLTKDGFELAFGTNHLGHYLFTRLLLPRLRAAAPARIVNVSSKAHYEATGIDWDALRKPTASVTGLPEYRVSKLANVLFTAELARGEAGPGVHSYSLHPGVVASDVWRRVPWPIRWFMKRGMLTNEEGAQTSLYCATSSEVFEHDGRYYDKSREKEPSALSKDPALARELWDKSEAWVKAFLT